jgi:AraC family transcriptional regulator of adaptative response / DNA-3-methyladenine glycosylase II
MRPSDDVCYRAIRSRDARFDGWFFVGVRTTGIYCRPSCPALTPRRENVTFHSSAAAAQASGFRACKRCRPDATPGSPAWNVRADVAGRALRLIGDGLVDRDGVAGLATRLGYSARQIQRTLVAEVGAGPLALARAQRAQTARILLETTAMPISDIAFAAGFGSIRQFNETLREVYASTPSELRARGSQPAAGVHRDRPAARPSARAAERAGDQGADRLPEQGVERGPRETAVDLRLAYRPPLQLELLLSFLRARAVPGSERADADGGYSAVLGAPHGPMLVRIAPQPTRAAGARAKDRVAPAVACRLLLRDVRDLALGVARVRALLDLDADPLEVDRVLGADPLLARDVAAKPGLRSPGALDGFGLAVRAIVGQQVSVAGARAVLGRIVAALGTPAIFNSEQWILFPTAEALAAADPAQLPLPAARIRTIQALAGAVALGELRLDSGADRAGTRDQLLALPGIGPWTADYIVMRALGDPDVLLDTDLVIRRALARAQPDEIRPDRAAPSSPAADIPPTRWAPWRSYASHHLWRLQPAQDAAAAADPLEG